MKLIENLLNLPLAVSEAALTLAVSEAALPLAVSEATEILQITLLMIQRRGKQRILS
jgi:hypothetical protein